MVVHKMAGVVALGVCGLFAAPPEMYPVRVNHIGWLPRAPKWCAFKNPPSPTFLVQKGTTNVAWETVYEGTWIKASSGGGFMLGDLSHITAPGDYRILCGEKGVGGPYRMPDWRPSRQSFHFQVRKGVYDPLKRLLAGYMTWQRCGSALGWAGCCHQDPVPLKDAAGKTLRHIDVRGGYHQSCDLRNWHDGISLSVYTLLRYAEREKPAWDKGGLAAEVRWGCDYFLKVLSPEGYVYDAQFAPIGWGARDYYEAPATLGAQCNVAMLFARAAVFFRTSDPAYAARLLTAAEGVWKQIETHPFFERAQSAPAKNLPAGAQPAERCYFQQWRTSVNGYAERAMAALELYRATGAAAYAGKAQALGTVLVSHLVREGEDAGYFRSSDATRAFRDWSYCWRASGVRTPLELYRTFKGENWKAAALAVAERMVRESAAKGMRPGKQASASRAAAQALYLAECAALFNRADYRVWAQRSFDWICGMNERNASYIEGAGQNQWQRPVFGQFFPSTPQIPGGIVHVEHGEYDMPAVAMTLWALSELS